MSLCGNTARKLSAFLVFILICFILYINSVDVIEELDSWYVDVLPQKETITRTNDTELDFIEKVSPHLKTVPVKNSNTQFAKIYSNLYTIPPHARLMKKEYKMNFGNLSWEISKYPIHFPVRNISALQIQIDNIKTLLQPFIMNLTKHRSELMLQHMPWPETRKPTVVANAYKDDYFVKMNHPAIHTLNISVDKRTILHNLHRFVYDYASNACHKVSSLDDADIFFDAHCLPKGGILKASSLQDNAWQIGLPANYTVQKDSKVTLTYIHVIKNAVITKNGDAFVDQMKIVPQRCHQNIGEAVPPIKVPQENEIFTIAQYGKSPFFNAIVEELPRIVPFLDFLRTNPDIKIHVNVPAGYLKRMLQILDIDQKRIISGTRRAHVLYMPAGSGCEKPNVFNTELLSLEFRARIPFSPTPRKSIVIIKRSYRQHFRQHAQIQETIKRLVRATDIRIESFWDKHLPSLNETMALFNRAFLVVAAYGAGEANLIFSEPGTVVVEGLCTVKGKANLRYRNLMRILGHRYYGHFPRDSCLDTTPNDIRGPVKYYIDKLYFGKT